MTDSAGDICADPQVQQILSECPATARVIISQRFSENIPKVADDGHLYARTLDDLLTSAGRETLAALQRSTTTSHQQREHDASDMEARRIPVSAVLELDQNNPSVDLLLGRAIRLFPYCLLVCTQNGEPTDTSFFALGFRRLNSEANSRSSKLDRRWYEYRISEYKSAPDWLNARFWANPERFSLAEDPDRYCDEEE